MEIQHETVSNKLQEIQGEIEATEKRLAELTASIETLKIRLKQRDADLQAAILAGENTIEIIVGISNLQIELSGTQKAEAVLINKLSKLRDTLAADEHTHFLGVAGAIKDQYLVQVDAIYERLHQVCEEIAKSKSVRIEYWQAIKQAKAMQNGPYNSKVNMITNELDTLEKEIKHILADHRK